MEPDEPTVIFYFFDGETSCKVEVDPVIYHEELEDGKSWAWSELLDTARLMLSGTT